MQGKIDFCNKPIMYAVITEGGASLEQLLFEDRLRGGSGSFAGAGRGVVQGWRERRSTHELDQSAVVGAVASPETIFSPSLPRD